MMTAYEKMEFCIQAGYMQDEGSFAGLVEYLEDADWRVRYAAAIALGDRKDKRAIAPLLAILVKEDAAPLYTEHEVELYGRVVATEETEEIEPLPINFPEGITEETKEAWRRRGRIKQAACLAIGSIGVVNTEALKHLQHYIVDLEEDYPVRSSACKALGMIADKSSIPFLEKMAEDEEWCTRTEALKALAGIKSLTAGNKKSC